MGVCVVYRDISFDYTYADRDSALFDRILILQRYKQHEEIDFVRLDAFGISRNGEGRCHNAVEF